MADEDCFSRVRALAAAVLGVEASALDASSCSATLALWDSLAHLQILRAVERHYGYKLPRLESYTVANLGELAALVERTRPT